MFKMVLGSTPAAAAPAFAGRLRRCATSIRRFAAAQNAHDLAAARPLLHSPDFLWVSHGQSFWGRDAVLARYGLFKKAEIGAGAATLPRARAVVVSLRHVAVPHLPLVPASVPGGPGLGRRSWLSALASAPTRAGNIAALFTTSRKALSGLP